ncbi:GNAT family N-acetyltransferase [Phenylobacterium sp.]|jgi:ribosomal protein S18 acetylase RimI-like enzyme|uniref:GNAT family N-acetyltransferase n=1 Tax=Phenylobacterium sp. TaxID=1871053 RepID=UPI002F400D16
MIPLEPAGEADHLDIVALTNRAYRHTGPGAGWAVETFVEGERLTAELLRKDLVEKPKAQLLAWRSAEGELQGHVWLEPAQDELWYLGLLTVRPDRQDRKLGRTLLAAAEDFARQRGARRMQMVVVNVRDTLIAWYERRGYVLTGETRPFPYGDDRFGRPLRDDLCFVVLERAL